MFKWQHLAAPCEYGNAQNLPASCFNFTMSDVLHIRISAKFGVEFLCDLFKLSSGRDLEEPVNPKTLDELPVSSCNFIAVFSISKYQKGSMLIFV